MKIENNVATSYQNNKVPFTYDYAPRPGYYKILSTRYMLWGRQLDLMAVAIWKPRGAKKDSPGITVDVHLEALNWTTSVGPKESLNQIALQGNIVEVLTVDTKTNKAGSLQIHSEWRLREIAKVITQSDANDLLRSDQSADIIDQFLSNQANACLFTDDQFDDFGDEIVDDTITDDDLMD
jgi:hypothetical protein